MNLRSSHAYPAVFDAALCIVAVALGCIGWLSFGAGGAWMSLGVLAGLGLLLMAYAVFVEPRRIRVARFREALISEPRTWIRLAFLSDFHAGGFRSRPWFERITREVQAIRPDLIVGGGDYVSDRAESISELSSLRDLKAPLGKYFVMGNHEYLDRPQDVRAALVSYGFSDVTNRAIRIEREGATLEIYGIDDHWRGNPLPFVRSSSATPHLLISHEPDALMDLSEGQTDLVLSGHTHGGQVRLPLVGSIYPIPAKLGRLVDRGRKIINGTKLIVSSGLGEQEGRVRLGCPAEIVIVEVGI